MKICQLTGTRLLTVLRCLDIVENYVHTMLLVAREHSEGVTIEVVSMKFSGLGLMFSFLGSTSFE